jgi:hypothetical protein
MLGSLGVGNASKNKILDKTLPAQAVTARLAQALHKISEAKRPGWCPGEVAVDLTSMRAVAALPFDSQR